MQKMKMTNAIAVQPVVTGWPTEPVVGRQPVIERKTTDPSSAFPRGEHYPIPTFFEYRIKPRDHDPL